MTVRTGAVLLMLIAPVHGASQAPSIYQRSISASATVTGSPKLRDGQFQLAGKAGICGVIPKESSLTGEASFVIETSDGITGSMTTITFGSKLPVAPATTVTRFNLVVGMVTANGGRPPNYVLSADSPRPGNTGIVTLTNTNGVSTLKVVGKNEANESIELTVKCG